MGVHASTEDVESWTEASKIWSTDSAKEEKMTGENGGDANGAPKDKTRSAVLDEQKYILPDSAVAIMRSIEEYEYLMANIPSMIQDIAPQLLEVLKLFNSRSSQLILGAGATRSAGLKNITTKHLALSSQALSFVIALVPYVREFVRRHGQANQIMADFDKVKRLCQEHQSGIHEKLVDIMTSRSSVHVAAMKKIDWDNDTSTGVHPYMETLAKETGTLHRVLSKHLPDMSVNMIMIPVFNNYRDQWTRAFEEAKVGTEEGKTRMHADITHLQSKLAKIEGAGSLGDKLLGIVNAKQVARVIPKTDVTEKTEATSEKQTSDQGADSSNS